MTFIYSFSEAFNLLLDRKRTVVVLLVISNGWILLKPPTGIDDLSSVLFLVYFIVLLLTIYYGFLIDYGLMRSIALGDEEELSLGKYIDLGKKIFWRAIGLGIITVSIMFFVAIILYFLIRLFTSLEMKKLVQLTINISSIVFMRLWIFAPALLVSRDGGVWDAFESVGRVSYGSAKHIFFLYAGYQVFYIFYRDSGAFLEANVSYPVMVLAYIIHMLIFVEAIRIVTSRGLDKKKPVYEAGGKPRLSLP